MKRFICICCVLIVTVILIVVLPEPAVSQAPGMPGEPELIPIDGGLALLAAAGGAYAIKKLRAKSR